MNRFLQKDYSKFHLETQLLFDNKLSFARWDLYPGALDVLDQNTQVSVLNFDAKFDLSQILKVGILQLSKGCNL